MSRSADSSPARHVGHAAALLVSGSLLCLLVATPTAHADPPNQAPIVAIAAPVVDIRAGSSSLDGTVAVEQRRNAGTAARLDSQVLFGKDSGRLRPAARKIIEDLAKQLRRDGPGKITVTGYTDDLGPAEHGLRLSRRRAAAVADLLGTSLGPDWPKIKTIGRGEADPAVPNTSEKNRRLNRRVIITVQR